MKKKTHYLKEEQHKDNYKTADNKEYTDNSDNQNSDDQAEPVENDIPVAVTPSDKVVEEVRAVEEKLAEMQDRYLRLSAEFDNYRKRTLREKMDLSKFATEDLLLQILPLMDDFERALQHMDSATDPGAMRNGIDLIYLKFCEFLKQNGVREIESLNSNFNVDLHEAVAKTPVAEEDKGKVVDVVLKGYYLQDKVIRFAKVVVGE